MMSAKDSLDDFDSGDLVEFFDFLDDLRESGKTNMYGSAAYLEGAFALSHSAARMVVVAWMDTFDDRPVDDRVFAALAKAGA
jgi:hypothetical protein